MNGDFVEPQRKVLNNLSGHEESVRWLIDKEARTKAGLQVRDEQGIPRDYATESDYGPKGFLEGCAHALSVWASQNPDQQEWLKAARAEAGARELKAARREAGISN